MGRQFVDRLRDTIRRLGENISSTALEAAVLADPDVLECAAVGIRLPDTGQEVLLAVVPRPGAILDPAQLFDRLAPQLPRYIHPSYVIVRAELPKTANGKVRKVGLLDTMDLSEAWMPTPRSEARKPRDTDG